MIIQCVKTNLRQIRCTGFIQGNRIEAAPHAFHSQRHDNMIFGLLHYRKCHSGSGGLWGRGWGWGSSSRYTVKKQGEFQVAVAFLFILSHINYPQASGSSSLEVQ